MVKFYILSISSIYYCECSNDSSSVLLTKVDQSKVD